ncbi:PE-PGRS family protein [Streptomyces sp. GS7]|uniref:PE-PGRS family protein n=1 Tax=Streptomyces sp. GS7 TaxID=2692234 RepID=UPI0013169F5C|nr:PE-PGRS family protein [Streptomyces sp. GS7]QHC26279.1 PE-PGRS family protein [Streptomyces sp. GS7]
MTAGSVSRAVRAAIFAVVCVTTAALGHALMSARPLPWSTLVAALGITGWAAWWLTGRERGVLVVTGSTVVAQLGLHSLFSLAQACRAGTTAEIVSERLWSVRALGGASGGGPAPESQAPAARMLHQAGLGPGATHASPPTPMDGMPGMSGTAGMDGMPSTSAAHVDYMGHLATTMHGDMSTSQMQSMHSGHGALGMFLAHALAALVCGLWMWRGEAAAFRLARSMAAVLFAPLLHVLTTLGWIGRKPPARPVAAAGHVVRLRGVLLQYAVSRRGPPGHAIRC